MVDFLWLKNSVFKIKVCKGDSRESYSVVVGFVVLPPYHCPVPLFVGRKWNFLQFLGYLFANVKKVKKKNRWMVQSIAHNL